MSSSILKKAVQWGSQPSTEHWCSPKHEVSNSFPWLYLSLTLPEISRISRQVVTLCKKNIACLWRRQPLPTVLVCHCNGCRLRMLVIDANDSRSDWRTYLAKCAHTLLHSLYRDFCASLCVYCWLLLLCLVYIAVWCTVASSHPFNAVLPSIFWPLHLFQNSSTASMLQP